MAKAKRNRRKDSMEPLVPIRGDVVGTLLRIKDLPLKRAAERAGMKRQTLDFIVRGRNKRARQDERAKLAAVLRVPVGLLSGERDMSFEIFSAAIEDLDYKGDKRQNGRPAVTRADIDAIAAVEQLEAVAPFFGASEFGSSKLKYACRVDTWRRLLGESRGWNESVADREDKDAFAAAAAKAFRALLRPWSEASEEIDALGPRLLAAFWNAFLAVYYAHRGPDRDGARVDMHATRIAQVFEEARRAAQSHHHPQTRA